MSPSNSVTILGCRIDNVTWDTIIEFAKQALKGSQARQIVTLNGEFILAAQRDEEFRQTINGADLVIPDSTNIVWVSRLRGGNLTQITPGSDCTVKLCELAAKMGKSVYFLGGRGGVAQKSAERLQYQFPGLTVAGWSEADPNSIDPADIAASGADIVLVAYGAPKQDKWIAKNGSATGAKLLMGVGGTFDMLAGRLPRAPKIMRALHLEWLWRLLLQPSRIGRIWNAVVVFPIRALLG